MNAEFQRIARRDKKAFLSDQFKEIEEINRIRKTRDLFKKIRDTKGTFHAYVGSIKDRNGVDLTEAEDIRGGKNTQMRGPRWWLPSAAAAAAAAPHRPAGAPGPRGPTG